MKSKMFFRGCMAIVLISCASTVWAADSCGPDGCPVSVDKGKPILLAQAQGLDKYSQKPSRRAPGEAHAMSAPPKSVRKVVPPPPAPPPTAEKPWERGKVYDAAWRKARIDGPGWYVTEARNNRGEVYNPRRFNVVGRDKELFKFALRDLHDSSAAEYGRKSYRIDPDERLSPQLQRQLHREGNVGFTSDVLIVTPAK